MVHLNQVDPGFDTTSVLTMDIPANTDGRTGDEVRNYYLAILDDARCGSGQVCEGQTCRAGVDGALVIDSDSCTLNGQNCPASILQSPAPNTWLLP